jgi:hypothetical protein
LVPRLRRRADEALTVAVRELLDECLAGVATRAKLKDLGLGAGRHLRPPDETEAESLPACPAAGVRPGRHSMTDQVPRPGSAAAARRVVRCARCGRADERSATELLRYTREGWPRCCGQVMALLTESVSSGPGDATG